MGSATMTTTVCGGVNRAVLVLCTAALFCRRLLAGGKACRPEDRGSTLGYERLVEFLKTAYDPYGESQSVLKQWSGDWDPEAFIVMEWKKAFDR